MNRDRNWFSTCGTCGGEARVKNAAIVRTATCRACEKWGTDPDDAVCVVDSLVVTEMGWCGCGNPEEVDRWMLAYLTARDHPDWPRAEGLSEDAERLIAYVADDLDWTEHGGGIGGAWLTDDGREAMANLRAAVAAFASKGDG